MPLESNENILDNNLDIKMAKKGLEVKKSMITLSESSYYPMVGAFAEIATADDKFLNEADDHKSYTIGARLTWNIFSGGVDAANIEKARLEYLKTKTQVQLASSGIELKIQKIKTEIESYNNDIESLKKELVLADEIYKNYEARLEYLKTKTQVQLASSGIELKIQKIKTEIESYNNDIESLKKELVLADEIYKNYEARYKEKLSSMSDVIIKQSEQIQKILQLQQTLNKRNERVFALEKLANGE